MQYFISMNKIRLARKENHLHMKGKLITLKYFLLIAGILKLYISDPTSSDSAARLLLEYTSPYQVAPKSNSIHSLTFSACWC